jgi:hypothetical protein
MNIKRRGFFKKNGMVVVFLFFFFSFILISMILKLLFAVCWAVLMDSHKEKEAIAELSRAIVFKADLHLLHLRAAFHEHTGDVLAALRDCRAALSVDPNHREMLELHSRVNSHEP